METGHKVEDLIAWRVWRIRRAGTGNYLSSVAHDCIWLPDQPMTGSASDHGTAGVYAFKRKDDALNMMMYARPNAAYGSVKLWGEVIEHKRGYRAENARILTIEDTIAGPAMLAELRERYNLPGVEQAKQQAKTTSRAASLPLPSLVNHIEKTRRKLFSFMILMIAATLINLAFAILNIFK